MKRAVEWSEWVQAVRQEIDGLEDMGTPLRVEAEQEPLGTDLFVEVLSDLEQRGIAPDALLGVVSPRQVVGLLLRVNFLDRRPAAADDDRLLPENVTLHGVSLRVEPAFPDDTLVLFPPGSVMFDGTAVNPTAVAVVRGLQDPDLNPETDPITVSDVREDLFSSLEPGGRVETTEEADPERRGERFVSDPADDEATGGDT